MSSSPSLQFSSRHSHSHSPLPRLFPHSFSTPPVSLFPSIPTSQMGLKEGSTTPQNSPIVDVEGHFSLSLVGHLFIRSLFSSLTHLIQLNSLIHWVDESFPRSPWMKMTPSLRSSPHLPLSLSRLPLHSSCNSLSLSHCDVSRETSLHLCIRVHGEGEGVLFGEGEEGLKGEE